ncbi:hypothetical protein GH714_037694 [Hevea brasiliensis]|uniref:Uncharacterized protein n=1 Tax=Hevea brasiliensis TaxID=3981 RepID=A0A6A6LYH1_HEVBR|nr:hypothetical protein GH714_037694 [Hevea brasiliensis]
MKENPLPIGIRGIILCKSGSNYEPIQGAVTRVTCLPVDENGYETAPFSVLSYPSDAKGYFFATLYPSQISNDLKIAECKAFLEDSPLQNCKVPTDVNKGISGSEVAKPNDVYGPKPKSYTKKDGYSPKPESDVVKNDDSCSPKPYFDKPGYGYGLKPENPIQIGVEGLVPCKSGSSYVPVEDNLELSINNSAFYLINHRIKTQFTCSKYPISFPLRVQEVARITCSALDQNGYETTSFSCLTSATDAKGYFFKTLSLLGLEDNLKVRTAKLSSKNLHWKPVISLQVSTRALLVLSFLLTVSSMTRRSSYTMLGPSSTLRSLNQLLLVTEIYFAWLNIDRLCSGLSFWNGN